MSFLNRCIWNATSTGTGSFVAASAAQAAYLPSGCLDPAVIDGATYHYFAVDTVAGTHEEGDGVWTTSTSTLTRATIRNSSNSGSAVSFANIPVVFMGTPAANDVMTLATANMTWHVATTGSDSNPGTSGSPFLTLQHALNIASGYNWNNQFFPTINIADGTYTGVQVVLPALFNSVNFGGLIVGNNTTVTNVKLADAGTGYTFTVASFAAWRFGGIDFTGTFAGFEILEGAIAAQSGPINFGGTLVQGGYLIDCTGQFYSNGGGMVISTTTSSMGPLINSRGTVINDDTSFVFTNPVVFTGSVVLLDSTEAFWAIDGATFTNASNVSITGGTVALSIVNGAFVEADLTTMVDGAILTRANFPGGAVVTDMSSVFQPDWGLYLASASNAISNQTSVYLVSLDVGGKAFIFGSTGTTNGFGAGNFTLFNSTDNRGIFTYNFASGQDRMTLPNTMVLGWDGTTGFAVPALIDTGLARHAAGVVEANNGTPGTLGGLIGSTILSGSATGGVGYAKSLGVGGTVTQATSKATAVTLSKLSGQITMNAAALAASTTVSFTLTNTALAAGDIIAPNHVSGGTAGSYHLNAQVSGSGGSASINVRNVALASLSEAIVIGFVVIKGTTN